MWRPKWPFFKIFGYEFSNFNLEYLDNENRKISYPWIHSKALFTSFHYNGDHFLIYRPLRLLWRHKEWFIHYTIIFFQISFFMSILNLLYSSTLKLIAGVIILREVFELILTPRTYMKKFMLSSSRSKIISGWLENLPPSLNRVKECKAIIKQSKKFRSLL